MINWKELEKFIAPGKVVTLVVIIDGKEIGALSFNVDTLAYKEILEVAEKAIEKPIIADKAIVAKSAETLKSSSKKADKSSSKSKTTEHVKASTITDNENTSDNNDDESPFIDEETGEVIEDKVETKVETKVEPERLTREQIMMEGQKTEEFPEKVTSKEVVEEKKETSKPEVVEQTFGEDW